jgi:hypothetical protein
MNREEILNMPAGIEMDAMIGAKIFGIKQEEHSWSDLSGNQVTLGYFSTDIAAAFEVVEKLCRENGCDVVKVCKRDPELWGEWSCNFGLGAEAFADTAPLAICRAALLTITKESAARQE